MKLGSIGAGHMGGCIIRTAIDTGLYTPGNVFISSPIQAELDKYPKCFTGMNNIETVCRADLIILAVRPAQAEGVLSEVAAFTSGKCILSICAGIPTSKIKSLLPPDAYVIRVMPNLPMTYGLGATVMAKPDGVPEEFVAAAKKLFEAGGICETLDEELLNAATALGGSGVAYFFHIADIMSKWAAENGIPEEQAHRIVTLAMAGASQMLLRSKKTPKELADAVAVPGGTTEAAFHAFEAEGFARALTAGMDACRNRGITLVPAE